MTKAEFDFKLNLGCQLFFNKFKKQPDIVYIDDTTHNNLLSEGYTSSLYPYKYKDYEISPFICTIPRDYMKLYSHNGKELVLMGGYE